MLLILDLNSSNPPPPPPPTTGTSHVGVRQCGTVETTLFTRRLPSRLLVVSGSNLVQRQVKIITQ